MAGENWTFWLNMTNFALGIVTLLGGGGGVWRSGLGSVFHVATQSAHWRCRRHPGHRHERLMAELRAMWRADRTACPSRAWA